MGSKHFSRKQRQLRYLVKKLNILLKQTDSDLKSDIIKMAAKIKNLVSHLSGIVSANRMKRILGAVALVIGVSFANTANAQYFAYPTTDPFGIAPGYGNYTQSVNLIDIDNDGDLDLFTDSVNYSYSGGYYSIAKNFNYQENIGTANNPIFNTPQLNSFNLSPVPNDTSFLTLRHFIDLDDDGDFDVLSNIIYQSYYSGFMSEYRYHENIGTPSSPNFSPAVTNPFGLQDSPNIEFSAIGDIDNDGDFDLINASLDMSAGQQITFFNFIENTGTNLNPMFTIPQTNTFGLLPVAGVRSPELTDLDNDGDLDIIFGGESYNGGQFIYHENTGTINAAQFATAVINPYGLNGSVFDAIPTFEFEDLDNDGDLDLLTGAEDETFYFENVLVQQAVTYECINYSCVDPGTGNGTYTTLAACSSSCTIPVTYDCNGGGNCYDPMDGSGQYATLASCQTNCVTTYDCDPWNGFCYNTWGGMGQFSDSMSCVASCQTIDTWECDFSTGDCYNTGGPWGGWTDSISCAMFCEVPESWNCVGPGDCQDPGDGSGDHWYYIDCMNDCPIPVTYDCDAVTGCYDPGTGQGLYTSLTGCQANCNTTSINSQDLANFNIFPNPISDVLNIKSDKEIIKVEISDILGKIILSEINPKNSINVKRLQKGIYSIKITFKDENSIIQKIIK